MEKFKLPIDDKDGLVVTLSVMRGGKGEEIQHFMEDKHITSEDELINIAIKAAELLWETKKINEI